MAVKRTQLARLIEQDAIMSWQCFHAALATNPAGTAWKAANILIEQRMALTCWVKTETALVLPFWKIVPLCSQQCPHVALYCTDECVCKL